MHVTAELAATDPVSLPGFLQLLGFSLSSGNALLPVVMLYRTTLILVFRMQLSRAGQDTCRQFMLS